MTERSDVFENMGDDYYATNRHKWHRFAPAWCAIQAQEILSNNPAHYFGCNNAATQQTLKWWNEAVKFGFIDC